MKNLSSRTNYNNKTFHGVLSDCWRRYIRQKVVNGNVRFNLRKSENYQPVKLLIVTDFCMTFDKQCVLKNSGRYHHFRQQSA